MPQAHGANARADDPPKRPRPDYGRPAKPTTPGDVAVVAARVEGKWLILDNRRLALVRDREMVGSIPEFVLDAAGARRFVPSTRTGQGTSAGRSVRHA